MEQGKAPAAGRCAVMAMSLSLTFSSTDGIPRGRSLHGVHLCSVTIFLPLTGPAHRPQDHTPREAVWLVAGRGPGTASLALGTHAHAATSLGSSA